MGRFTKTKTAPSSNGYRNEKRLVFHPVATQEQIADIHEAIGWFSSMLNQVSE